MTDKTQQAHRRAREFEHTVPDLKPSVILGQHGMVRSSGVISTRSGAITFAELAAKKRAKAISRPPSSTPQ